MTVGQAASALVDAVAASEGVELTDLRSILVRPACITIELYENDAAGSKFINSNGDVATVVHLVPLELHREAER